MKSHIDSLSHELFPKVNDYLSGTKTSDQRFITSDTLKKFKVGVGTEKFFDEELRQWKHFEVVYFPMYSPLSNKQKKLKYDEYQRRVKDMPIQDQRVFRDELLSVEVADDQLQESDELTPEHFEIELVKTKVRAIG